MQNNNSLTMIITLRAGEEQQLLQQQKLGPQWFGVQLHPPLP